jgi:malate dehydrogenase (oxaloacetate-decarboxylating)(NADP+)
LLGKERLSSLNPEQQEFVRDEDDKLSLLNVVKKYQPTILLGVTAVGGLFTEELVREMAKHVDRPIIFPLSNPTTKAECTAEQAFEWTDGNCVYASGSPFDPVEMDDGRVFSPSQCNNMYIFPGLGLGATLCGAKRVTDRMLYVAAKGTLVFGDFVCFVGCLCFFWSSFRVYQLGFCLFDICLLFTLLRF